jgi:nicotinamidase-related amidase
MTQALLVVDAQNEFSSAGQRPVPNHAEALKAIARQVDAARRDKRPIAWIQHHNRPDESAAFVPHTWGAELSPGLGPQSGGGEERLFEKDVFGAFSGTDVEAWLRALQVDTVLIVGFYTHMCVSTSAREALVRGFDVRIDLTATGACDLSDPVLGRQTSDEVRRAALLHLTNMGVAVIQGVAAEDLEGCSPVTRPDAGRVSVTLA